MLAPPPLTWSALQNFQYPALIRFSTKGKVKNTYEFGGKSSLAITHKKGLTVGAKTFLGTPYDGPTLPEQIEQTNILLVDQDGTVKTVYADLGYRGVDDFIETATAIHRGKATIPKQTREEKVKTTTDH